MKKIKFETVILEAVKLPMVKIDRELFLRSELKGRYSSDIVDKAIQHNPAYAGVCLEDINEIARSCIRTETNKVTALSAASGIPGGIAMIGTVPADIAQYYGHILRVLQKLIYLYGWSDININSEQLSDETKNTIIIFLGVMFSVNGANSILKEISSQVSKNIVKKLPQKALTKGVVYPIVKRIASLLGQKMTKEIFARSISKIVPIVGAITSGGLTFVTFKPMAEKLRKHLSTLELADPEYYKNINDEDVIDL